MADTFTVYVGVSVCPFCDKAKELLNEQEMNMEVIPVEDMDMLEEIREKAGKDVTTIPQIFHGEKYVGGYEDLVKYMNTYLNELYGE